MEFHQLEAFVAVVTHRSFSKAAGQLFLSQPTVSAHVKSLEKELNTPLLDRGRQELTLTAAGEALFRHAQDLLALREQALAEIREQKDVGQETLFLAASSVPGQYLLPRAVAAFEEKYPQVTVRLMLENSRRVCEDVQQYRFPLGIVGDLYQLERLEFTPLVKDELVVAIPNCQEYADLLRLEQLSVEKLYNYTLLLRESGSGTRSLFEEALSKAGLALDSFNVKICDNQEVIKQSVRHGLGVTVISQSVVEDYAAFGWLKVRKLTNLSLIRSFYLVRHQKRILSPAAAKFCDFLVNHFREVKP